MTAASNSPGRPPLPSLVRAALLGLCGGMFSGGVLLLFYGLSGLFGKQDCTRLSELECELLVDAATHVGRVQTICGGALIALGLCLIVLARPYLSPPPPPSAPPSMPPPAPPSGSGDM
ncbi:hypothetical protein [Stigmatella aurantiaca]|uniref:Uncharacterized protein n=1 Tax=Stigmatella aurantiaca (strain DW4/3-1) TaxID=378806 RepID=Q08Y22_STIAD|nr:hypothetical protein [Stigmatella aurantiaca]ADO69978.1 uncharacterized protein STAUR_2174 [Stigmatella aurantiaca DW4/3-1]EAU65378.1 hypothetical protein STIAU_2171 [Stigmatella aurantiaca DW4/3-1]